MRDCAAEALSAKRKWCLVKFNIMILQALCTTWSTPQAKRAWVR